MAKPKQRNRSDYFAGLVILSCGVCVLIATGLTAHFRANPIGYQDYLVNFSLANGVQGIQMGSPVDFGGLNVGQVTGLQYQEGNLQVKISLEPSMGCIEVRRFNVLDH